MEYNYKLYFNYACIYELSNLDHVLGVPSQTKVSGGNRTHDPDANNLTHYPLEYQVILVTYKVICYWEIDFEIINILLERSLDQYGHFGTYKT